VTTSTISGIDLPLEGAVDGGKSEVRYFMDMEGQRAELERFSRSYSFRGPARRYHYSLVE